MKPTTALRRGSLAALAPLVIGWTVAVQTDDGPPDAAARHSGREVGGEKRHEYEYCHQGERTSDPVWED
jgi:hypothetical protein